MDHVIGARRCGASSRAELHDMYNYAASACSIDATRSESRLHVLATEALVVSCAVVHLMETPGRARTIPTSLA